MLYTRLHQEHDIDLPPVGMDSSNEKLTDSGRRNNPVDARQRPQRRPVYVTNNTALRDDFVPA